MNGLISDVWFESRSRRQGGVSNYLGTFTDFAYKQFKLQIGMQIDV